MRNDKIVKNKINKMKKLTKQLNTKTEICFIQLVSGYYLVI